MYHYYQSSAWIDGAAGPDIQVASRPDAALLLPSEGAFPSSLPHQQEEQQQQPRVVRYTAEERRERIDKYRSKRNQRNFQKKITYACRKTLADSRPRVKGRFARGEYYADPAEAQVVQAAAAAAGTSSESPPVNNVVVTSKSSNDDNTSMPPEWWPAMEEALATGVDLCDEEMLAAYLGVSSISLYSPSYSPSASSYTDQ